MTQEQRDAQIKKLKNEIRDRKDKIRELKAAKTAEPKKNETT